MQSYHIYRPLLDLIGKAEGTDMRRGGQPARGYNETLAYGALTAGDVELVRMSLDEVDALQTAMLRHPANRWNSSALGRYQIIRTTLREIRTTLKLTGRALFDRAMQDRMACFLLGRRGIDRWLAGQLDEDALINALAQEWASFPTTSGAGHYAGQGTGATLAELRAALAEVGRRHAGRPAPAPAPRPQPDDPGVAPGEDPPEPISHSTRFWTWLTTGGAGAGLLTDVAGLDVWLQRGIGVVLIVLAVYAIVTMRQVRRKVGLS